ncbi:MAG: hypothetical protein HGGPFJEG_01029 [Ignavibacteria bacterium]|nr:hypothetical protein [Ignavibacteria bacterium]
MKEMDEYYFLKATLTVPTKILLTSKQITDNMKKIISENTSTSTRLTVL